jgi:SAM-dependent methyltransferase
VNLEMLLKSDSAARKHREKKRTLEIEKIIAELECIRQSAGRHGEHILEFGCGNGFQIPYLKTVGTVVATDIYTSRELKNREDVCFLESNIVALPFTSGAFSLVFSNHVVEHLPDPVTSFQELKRVGREDCLYLFSVPTNHWLLLSLPQKYMGKCVELLRIISKYVMKSDDNKQIAPDTLQRMDMESRLGGSGSRKRSFLKLLLPKGHGEYPDFLKCYRAFKVKSWNSYFINHGFAIEKVVPLMLYGPSERPIIPTTDKLSRYGFCSSVLFVLSKGDIVRYSLPKTDMSNKA